MAWVTPPTFVSGNVLTAAQLNTLGGDLNETAPAKATAAGQLFVSTAANAITPRTPTFAQIDTAETTTSIASYGDLATVGPAVTVTVSASAIVFYSSQISNATGTGGGQISWAVTGASTLPAPNGHVMRMISSNAGEAQHCTKVNWQQSLTAGSNTFTLKYTTPTGGTCTFQFREILVFPL
jgi:hypothetical protein